MTCLAYLICIIPLVVNSLTFFDRVDTFSFVLPYPSNPKVAGNLLKPP